MTEALAAGLTHRMEYTVPPERTVPHILPEAPGFAEMPDVLATGYMVAIIEWACVESIKDHLGEDDLTLGTHVDLTHQAPTVPGSMVTIDVTVTHADRRSLEFAVEARDEHAVISVGTHKRGIVSRSRFDERIAAQAG
ncbi:thioesterase family protein [Brevibacterium oceani]|uniref:thioesterase family protein n=1 Tax=Brevibacterium oceani TaxID=358099 RepID=UPI001B3453AE|nr:thioesterase family protein [Brevibacterium oceani]